MVEVLGVGDSPKDSVETMLETGDLYKLYTFKNYWISPRRGRHLCSFVGMGGRGLGCSRQLLLVTLGW